MLLNGHIRALLAVTVVFVVAMGSARVGKQGDDGSAADAIGALRAIHSAQQSFASVCAAGGYAASLNGLVTAPSGSSTGFLSPDFPVSTTGYAVLLEPGSDARPPETASCNGAEVVSTYFVHAEPHAGVSGASFAMHDHSGIYMRRDGRPIGPGLDGAELLP